MKPQKPIAAFLAAALGLGALWAGSAAGAESLQDVLQRYFEDDGLVDVPFYRGRGCPYCRNTGYRGRVAFHELGT